MLCNLQLEKTGKTKRRRRRKTRPADKRRAEQILWVTKEKLGEGCSRTQEDLWWSRWLWNMLEKGK